MLAKVAGSNQFKVGNGKATWSELEFMAPLTVGSGLGFDSNGNMVVDFSQMPTDKFESLLKQLRLPIWLEKNTDFYVDGATGSDVISEGRGLSTSKAFKTIQACIDYVCDYFTFQKYYVRILVDYKSTYTERIILKDFQGENYLYLYAANNGVIDYKERVKVIWNKLSGTSSEATVVYLHGNKKYQIFQFDFQFIVNETLTLMKKNCSAVLSSGSSATVYFSSCRFSIKVENYTAINSGSYNLNCTIFSLFGPNTVNISPWYTYPTEIEFINIENLNGGTHIVFSAVNNSNLSITYCNSSYGWITDFNIKIKKMTYFVTVNTSGYFNYQKWNISGYAYMEFKYPTGYSNPTGQRYRCISGGKIDVSGLGTSALPGTVAGTVETSTYSWYK